MLCNLLIKRRRVFTPPLPPRSPGVLWPPTTQPHTRLHSAHRGLRCSLRAVPSCEAHFELWRKLFCLVPCSQKGSIFEVGSAEVWRIAGTGYLSGTPKKASKEWPSEWFYIEYVILSDPIRHGLPEFSNRSLKKRHSWGPRAPRRRTLWKLRN